MSSRALRKAQKEREKLKTEQQAQGAGDSEDDTVPITTNKKSTFEMLAEVEPNEGDEAEDEEEEDTTLTQRELHSTDAHTSSEQVAQQRSEPNVNPKRKKKKKKAKAKTARPKKSSSDEDDEPGDNEHRRAFAILPPNPDSNVGMPIIGSATMGSQRVAAPSLAIDTHHLNVSNEMRRLFGKAALEAEREEELERSSHQQRLRQSEQVGLADAVKGAYSPYGAGLPGVIRRRNIFIHGKASWPRAPSNGLGMDVVERINGICVFRFTHNKAYQQAQKEFDTCVLSMDPSLMVNLLRFNPYHISSLLQVSEIAKHEKDYATAGDLLERALFSFGRATINTFTTSLAQGKARLDFLRPENREFWVAGWKYLQNLSMRGTWRTAFEWAKLLFSLDPVGDPYQIQLIIDQLALRARQPQQLVDYVNQGALCVNVERPNLEYSKSLALRSIGSKDESRATLKNAIEQYPWMAVRLLQEAGVERIPSPIWGQQATGELNALRCELYAAGAIDLWKTSEALDFLRDTASQVRGHDLHESGTDEKIGEAHARHVLLTDKPTLIALLPRKYTSNIESSADPVPPVDNVRSYDTGVSDAHREYAEIHDPGPPVDLMIRNEPEEFIRELHHVQRFFERLIPGFLDPAEDREEGVAERLDRRLLPRQLTDEALDRAINDSNLSIAQMRARLFRLVALREQLMEQEGQVVRSEEGSEARMIEDGRAQITFAVEGEHPSHLPYLQEQYETSTEHEE